MSMEAKCFTSCCSNGGCWLVLDVPFFFLENKVYMTDMKISVFSSVTAFGGGTHFTAEKSARDLPQQLKSTQFTLLTSFSSQGWMPDLVIPLPLRPPPMGCVVVCSQRHSQASIPSLHC